MERQTILLDGNRFSTLSSFYEEVERVLTKNLEWSIGRNLDAFNDVLRGGFGVYGYEEPVLLVWRQSKKSRTDLGWDETVRYEQAKLKTCHPSNIESVGRSLEMAGRQEGQTLFERIVDIIQEYPHVELRLE